MAKCQSCGDIYSMFSCEKCRAKRTAEDLLHCENCHDELYHGKMPAAMFTGNPNNGWHNLAARQREKTHWVLLMCLLFISGCNTVNLGDVPVVFDPNDYQALKAGQSFTPQRDGVYFSYDAARKWIRAKTFEYEMNKRGFNEQESGEKK